MELPAKRKPKRTPKRGILKLANLTLRLTRSKTKSKVNLSPATKEKITSAVKRKIPASIGIVGRYKFRDEGMRQLKNLDAITLQNLCNEEGVAHNGKFDAIFNLAEHRTYIAYGTENDEKDKGEKKLEEEEVTTVEDVEDVDEEVD
ncbi:hypothetical protein CBR_g1089 [Chara braunii]|uniref:Uncharacterized protein n=1 Tax=Chara braunii TaxID=69332 RepID=A0A388KD32_CHABU|nr:hypothetical protein CBR_g1089 [Chara braunii]|eukprot:GBG67970.1 hypothetical protein CBR_g1089 [Chara braunii]